MKKEDIFILIISPFKTGTCYIEEILEKNEIKHNKLHGYNEIERKIYPIDKITHVITLRRELRRLYSSAFFEDIDKPEDYEYAYGTPDEVEKASVSDLVKHFKLIDWTKYRWLNNEHYDEIMDEFIKKGIPVLKLKTENLKNEIEQLPIFLGLDNMGLTYEKTHMGIESKYGEKYKLFLKQVFKKRKFKKRKFKKRKFKK